MTTILAAIGALLIGSSLRVTDDNKPAIGNHVRFWLGVALVAQWFVVEVWAIIHF